MRAIPDGRAGTRRKARGLEAGSHLELLARVGAVDPGRAARALALLDRVRALTWRLIHPRR